MSVLVIRTPDGVAALSGAIPVLAAAAADPRWAEVHVIFPASLALHLPSLPTSLVLHPIGDSAGEHEALKRIGAEAALLLTSSFASARAAWRAGIPIRAGAQGGGLGFLLTHSVRQPSIGGREAPIPGAHLMRDLAGLLGIAVADLPSGPGASTGAGQHPQAASPPGPGSGLAGLRGAPGADPTRLLVRLPRWLGDVVMAEPTLDALHEELGSGLTLAGGAPLLELLASALPSARLQPCGRRPDHRPWKGHDAALLLDGSMASAWTAVRAGIPCRVGLARRGQGLLLTKGLRPPLERGRTPLGLGRHGRWPRRLPRPFGATCTELAALLGVSVPSRRPRLMPSEAARAEVRAWRGGNGPYLALQAGGRPGSAKALEPQHWRQVLEALRSRGFEAPVYLLAGPGEERAAVEAAGVRGVQAVVEPVADLPQLAAWLEGASLVLCTDGGPRHVAQAVGSQRVVLFGPTDPRFTTETGADEVQLRDEVPCGPCHRERCPLPARVCQQGFTPERVAEAVLAAWPTC